MYDVRWVYGIYIYLFTRDFDFFFFICTKTNKNWVKTDRLMKPLHFCNKVVFLCLVPLFDGALPLFHLVGFIVHRLGHMFLGIYFHLHVGQKKEKRSGETDEECASRPQETGKGSTSNLPSGPPKRTTKSTLSHSLI